MSTRKRYLGALVVASIVALLACLRFWSGVGLDEADPVGVSGGHASGLSESGDRLSKPIFTELARGRVQDIEGKDENAACAFFDPWRELECSRRNVLSFLKKQEGLGGFELSCIPAEWLLYVMVLHCEGTAILGVDPVATELTARLPEPIAFSKSPVGDVLSFEVLSCLVSSLLSENASPEEIGKAWAWALMATFGDKGSLAFVDPEVVAALRSLMGGWPLGNDEWWSHLWSALPGDPHNESVHLRMAIFEALHGVLPKAEWVQRLASLAALEKDIPGGGLSGVGSMSLLVAGQALAAHLSDEDYAVLMTNTSDSYEWQRALMLGLPRALYWPNEGNLLLSDSAKQRFLETTRSEDYPYYGDMLDRQWGIIGPRFAVGDLEKFIFYGKRDSEAWGFKAGMRISAAISATLLSNAPTYDDSYLRDAESLIRELVVVSTREETQAILFEMRYNQVLPMDGQKNKAWRKKFAQVLGPKILSGLDQEYQDWLSGG